ncbi:MAG TPA: NUMOD4 domain-containing protein, partial [Puia sp.]|nr:NUMOD4 domain-containing protein [Puia sp.]
MTKNQSDYPYQNTSLEDLPSERWADLPGFEGEYEISSLGRIKSLRRWRNCGNNSGYYTKEIIRKQHARFKKNKLLRQNTYTIGNTLKKNGKSYSTSTSRFVYYAFVEPFDLDDKQLMISYKDCNGRNLHYDNLILTNFSEIHKRSFELNRHHSRFTYDRLPIRQLSMDGKLIQNFPSLTDAEKKTGIHISGISACLKNRIYQFQGFRWEVVSKNTKPSIVKADDGQIFNEYLWKKIGMPRTSKMNPIPALNIGSGDLQGEKWKAMEGLEASYLVSNFGRIRALPRFKYGGISQ